MNYIIKSTRNRYMKRNAYFSDLHSFRKNLKTKLYPFVHTFKINQKDAYIMSLKMARNILNINNQLKKLNLKIVPIIDFHH